MNIHTWNDTWGTINWAKDPEDEIKQKITEFYNAGVDFNMDEEYDSTEAYLDEILSKSNNQQKMHDELFAKYNSESNREIKNKIAVELNECTARLNAYNESYNIISKYYKKNISSKVTNPKIKERKPVIEKKEEVDKKEVKPEERKPIEEKAEERKPVLCAAGKISNTQLKEQIQCAKMSAAEGSALYQILPSPLKRKGNKKERLKIIL